MKFKQQFKKSFSHLKDTDWLAAPEPLSNQCSKYSRPNGHLQTAFSIALCVVIGIIVKESRYCNINTLSRLRAVFFSNKPGQPNQLQSYYSNQLAILQS